MDMVLYDGSFEGLLTAVFEIYEYKIQQPVICKNDSASSSLFGVIHPVQPDITKCERVYNKLKEKLTKNALSQLYKTFLSEIKDIENILFRYIRYVLTSKVSVENDFSHPDVLALQQISRKVHREKHRMEAFVRFQCTKDKLYYALIQPDYNVLPLISKHFEDRYADQRWLIYDSVRNYGLYYDLVKTEEVFIAFETDLNNQDQLKGIYDEHEELYQSLWRQYFQSVNIQSRKNMKLHIQHMPKRYWKNLIEKKQF